jgi:multisubunit Na+/H+ antiporter MnhC subunit
MLRLIRKSIHAARSTEGNVLARSVTVNLAGRVGYLLVGFVAAIVLARLLGPSGRGLLGLMLSFNSVALVVTTIGVPLAIVYFASLRDADQGALLGNSLVQAVVLTVVLAVVVVGVLAMALIVVQRGLARISTGLATLAGALEGVEAEHLRPLEGAVQAINAQFDIILSALPGIARKAAVVAERRPR